MYIQYYSLSTNPNDILYKFIIAIENYLYLFIPANHADDIFSKNFEEKVLRLVH